VTEICVEQLVVNRGSRRVLDDVTLRVRSCERVAIIGPNGAGKSTLMRAILGLQPATSGRITLDGAPTAMLTPLNRAAKIAWLPQQALVDEPVTAIEFVKAARYRMRENPDAAKGAALRALDSVGAKDWADRLITRLSGGEQQRVALAALLAQEASAFLVDEPANHLDPAQQVSVWRLLARVGAERTVVIITHDINLVPLLGKLSETRIIALDRGRLAFDTVASDPALAERLSELYGMQMQVYGQSANRVIVPSIGGEQPS